MGLVIGGLSNLDCARNGLTASELDNYRTKFIDREHPLPGNGVSGCMLTGIAIADLIQANSRAAFALVVEPNTLPRMIDDGKLSGCESVIRAYRELVPYAIKKLNLPNAVVYLDMGHGGNLGMDGDTKAAAEEIATIFKAAGSPSQVRGFATNVASYNSW